MQDLIELVPNLLLEIIGVVRQTAQFGRGGLLD